MCHVQNGLHAWDCGVNYTIACLFYILVFISLAYNGTSILLIFYVFSARM